MFCFPLEKFDTKLSNPEKKSLLLLLVLLVGVESKKIS